jgi:hypothetical protein
VLNFTDPFTVYDYGVGVIAVNKRVPHSLHYLDQVIAEISAVKVECARSELNCFDPHTFSDLKGQQVWVERLRVHVRIGYPVNWVQVEPHTQR